MTDLLTKDDVSGSECVTTSEVGGGLRTCNKCGIDISHKRPQSRYCSRECQHSSSTHSARDMEAQLLRELKQVAYNIVFKYLNRDRSMGFDGRYQGPMNKSVTTVATIKKDKGHHPMPIDVHVQPSQPKFTQVTPEDVEWAERQDAFAHSHNMPRTFRSFCPNCIEVVVDGSQKKVRVTKGVYLPVDHDCNSVRVYDLKNNLLEVKAQ